MTANLEVIKFNINDRARVKLTEFGRQVWLLDWLQYRTGKDAVIPEVPVDSEGYFESQLHDIMHVFGSTIYMGGPLPFETTIELIPSSK